MSTHEERPLQGLVSFGVGLAAAGVGAALGLAAERAVLGRPLLAGRAGSPEPGPAYGSLRGPARVVTSDDGVELYVEVDEPDPQAQGAVTVVMSHGYCLTLDAWHYQRLALRGQHRLVLWDQRGHGRSASGPEGSATIDRIGRDLAAVIDAVAPTGPLVLLGHSMGGMTVMSLAEERPALFAERVIGVGLVATSAGGRDLDLGLAGLGRLVLRLAPGVVKTLSRTPRLVERGRRLGSDLELVLVGRYSFGTRVPLALVRFAADMIASTRLEVISEFLPTLSAHDKREALAALDGLEVLVLVGTKDLLTPAEHSEEIVRRLPGAELVLVRDGGHLVMLEHPDVVSTAVRELIGRALRGYESSRKRPRPAGRVRRTVTSIRRHGRRNDGAA